MGGGGFSLTPGPADKWGNEKSKEREWKKGEMKEKREKRKNKWEWRGIEKESRGKDVKKIKWQNKEQ